MGGRCVSWGGVCTGWGAKVGEIEVCCVDFQRLCHVSDLRV